MRKIFSWHLYVCFRPSAMLHPQLSELQNIHREVASKQFELRDGPEPRKFLTPNTCFYTLSYLIMCTAFVYNHQFIVSIHVLSLYRAQVLRKATVICQNVWFNTPSKTVQAALTRLFGLLIRFYSYGTSWPVQVAVQVILF